MLHVALWEPEIPPNTGNVARLCAATATTLHLIGRLGFHLDDRSLRRAGLDYWPDVAIQQHITLEDFRAALTRPNVPAPSIYAFSARAERSYTTVHYQAGDVLLFGSESRGLPASMVEQHCTDVLTIPMLTTTVRSLNLATAVGIVLYEALRQLHGW